MDAVEIRTATADDLEGVVASSAALFAEDSGTRDPLRNADWPAVRGATRLHVTACATNNPALHLYHSCGFTPNSITLNKDI